MSNPMSALSPLVIQEFCYLCDRAHELWLHHLELFDNNTRADELNKASFTGDEFRRLSIISHEYSMLQIVKLHDPAVIRGDITLGINCVLTYGDWSDCVRARLEELAKELNGFASPLRGPRNKILTHNDLDTIKAGATLGAFTEGADKKYFKALKEFANTVHEEVVGGPWAFDDGVRSDVAAFLDAIKPRSRC